MSCSPKNFLCLPVAEKEQVGKEKEKIKYGKAPLTYEARGCLAKKAMPLTAHLAHGAEKTPY